MSRAFDTFICFRNHDELEVTVYYTAQMADYGVQGSPRWWETDIESVVTKTIILGARRRKDGLFDITNLLSEDELSRLYGKIHDMENEYAD